MRSASKFPTYRRRFRQVVKALSTYAIQKEATIRSNSFESTSVEDV